MPKKIQEALTSLKLIKKFGLVGKFSPQLDETIVPVVITDDLTISEEWQHAFLHDARDLTVGQYPSYQLRNPVASGRVVQLLRLTWYDTATQTINVFVNDVSANLTTVLEPQFQELYEIVLAADAFPTAEMRFQSLVGLFTGPEAWGGRALQSTNLVWEPHHTLLYPGANLFVQPTANGAKARLTLEWRERNQRPDGS